MCCSVKAVRSVWILLKLEEYGVNFSFPFPGSPKTHGEKRTCPDEKKLAPCKCKVKSTGLDVTCHSVSRAQMERVATVMKQEIKPTTDVRHSALLVAWLYPPQDTNYHLLFSIGVSGSFHHNAKKILLHFCIKGICQSHGGFCLDVKL